MRRFKGPTLGPLKKTQMAGFCRGVARTGPRGRGPNLANYVSVVGRVSVKFPCYMLLTGRGGGGVRATQKPLNTPLSCAVMGGGGLHMHTPVLRVSNGPAPNRTRESGWEMVIYFN